jgi:hypothetical protein
MLQSKQRGPALEYAAANLSSPQQCSLEELRNAVADLLYAVSGAFQEKPKEAYGYVLHAAELLRTAPASAVASLYEVQSPAPPRGGLAPWMVCKVSTYKTWRGWLNRASTTFPEPFGRVSMSRRTSM